jgi:hypothetical protein
MSADSRTTRTFAARRLAGGLLLSCVTTLVPTVVTTAFLPSVVHAQAKPFAAPVVSLVPGGEVVANGKTEVVLSFVAYTPGGQPMTGFSGKVSGDLGDARLSEVRPGVYQATVVPPKTNQDQKATVELKGKAQAGPVEGTFTVHTVPAAKGSLTVKASPATAVLGRDTNVSISVKVDAADAAGADIQLVASAGSVQNVTSMGDGSFVAQYTPPNQQFPQLAIITAIDKRNPGKIFGHTVLPLVGQASFPVQAEPNASVIVQVDDQPFGPVPSDARGMAQVPITVPPGVRSAKIISIVDGKRLEDPLDLQVPHSQRVALFPVGTAVPADNTVEVPVRAYVADPSGQPDTNATVTFTAGSGTVSAATHQGGGIYEAKWTPAFGSVSTRASIQVSVADAKGPQSDSMEIALVPGRAASLALAAEPPNLGATTNAFKLYVKANGGPSGLAGRKLVIDGAGAEPAGAARDLGSGDYEQSFSTQGNSNVDIAIGLASANTGNPFTRVLVIPLEHQVPADGRSLQRLAVITVDAYGYPVGNVPVNLQVASGDGSVTGSVTTGADGIGFATYTAGTASGYMVVKARSGGKVGEAGFVQANGSVAAVNAPVSGTAHLAALTSAWRNSVGHITLTRTGGLAAAAPTANDGPAGPPAAVTLSSEPSSATPGGAVTIKISVVDASGRPAQADPTKFLFATTGTISAVQMVAPGQYQALMSIPADAQNQINVASSLAGSAVAAPILTIPLSGAVAGAWGVAPPPEQPKPEEPKPEEPKPEKPKKERNPSAKVDRPWLRAGGGYLGGFYGYKEISQQSGGPIYEEPISVGFGEGNAAGTFGMQLNAKAWLPFFKFVGFEAGFRGSRWQIQLDEGGSEPIADGLNAINARAHGRYPLDVGQTRLSFGGFVGFHASDFLYFSQVFDENDPTATPGTEYDQLWTVGNSYGVELGVEAGKRFFANGMYEMGFTDYSGIFSDSVELEVGYGIIDNMYVAGNVGRFHRATSIYYGDNKDYVGDLEDQHWVFGLMLGYQR